MSEPGKRVYPNDMHCKPTPSLQFKQAPKPYAVDDEVVRREADELFNEVEELEAMTIGASPWGCGPPPTNYKLWALESVAGNKKGHEKYWREHAEEADRKFAACGIKSNVLAQVERIAAAADARRNRLLEAVYAVNRRRAEKRRSDLRPDMIINV